MGYGLLEGWFSIIGNAALFFVKFFIGTSINSISLVADSFHTLSDTLTSVVVVIGFRMSAKAPDREHPFGHGRIEQISSIVIAVLLGIVGAAFMYESAARLIEVLNHTARPVEFSAYAALAIGLSVLFKEAMARLSINLGRMIDSQALRADAWHHRSDAIASAFVLLAIAAARFGAPWLDPVMGIGVSVLIIKVAADVLGESSRTIMGRVDKEAIARIERIVCGIAGCEGAYQIAVHDYGLAKVVSMHIYVSENASFYEAHFVADEAEKRIAREIGENVTTVVHVDPKHTQSEDVAKKAIGIVLGEKGVISAHKIQVIGGKKRMMIFHIFVDPEMSVKESHGITRSLKAKLAGVFDGEITIHVEPCEKRCGECISSEDICTARAAAAHAAGRPKKQEEKPPKPG